MTIRANCSGWRVDLDFAEWLASNPWFSILLLILAILALVLMVLFYFRSLRVRRPFFDIRSSNVFQDLLEKHESLQDEPLRVLYASHPIRNLTSTKFAFWNGGRETIRREDVAEAAPLLVRMRDGCRILKAHIISVNNEANRFSVEVSPDWTELKIRFDFLDKNDGFVLQMLHSGKSGRDMTFEGMVIGAGPPARRRVTIPPPPPKFAFGIENPRHRAALNGVVPLLILIAFAALLYAFTPAENRTASGNLFITVGVAFFVTLFLVGRILELRRRIPPGLEAFEEEF